LSAGSSFSQGAEKAEADPVRLGLILDMSGVYADVTGAGSAMAAKMAVEDFGGTVLGRPIEILVADHQNKAEIAAAQARRWFETQNVVALMDVAASATALAAQDVAKQHDKIIILNGPGTTRLTNENCAPQTVHYAYDTYALGNATLEVAEKNGLRFYASTARMELDWARARLGDADGIARLRGHKAFIGQGGRMFAPLYYARLAEIEAERTSAEEALTSIDHAIEVTRGSDIRYVDALLHRIRGDILLRHNPANAAPAEDAYLTAIAVAREQGARSFGLLAALSLANLYQSTGRLAEAHDVLGPALEGFAPTPEFPQIAEAKALLEALAAKDEVKAANASLNRRLRLQVAYGNALISARGYSAPETRAAFERLTQVRFLVRLTVL
jgi:Periplasmic binding protein